LTAQDEDGNWELVKPYYPGSPDDIFITVDIQDSVQAPWNEEIGGGTESFDRVVANIKDAAPDTKLSYPQDSLIILGPEFELRPSAQSTWGLYASSRTETYVNYLAGEFPEETTVEYGSWSETLTGQQSLAETRAKSAEALGGEAPSIIDAQEGFNEYVRTIGGKLVQLSSQKQIQSGSYPVQERPNTEDEIKAEQSDGSGDPNNGYRTESTAGLELALGSPLAKRRIEFSMPYAPDDYFIKIGTNPNQTYESVPSDAAEKARKYGRVQNNLLLGNRFGMNIQTAISRMPTGPLSPIVICADGFCALYRVNGTSWTMDSNGIIVSTDALFWGGVGTY
jgi:hypothetical protein